MCNVSTDRNEKATGALAAPEEVAGEQLQPCVVSVEYYFFTVCSLAAAPQLCEPGVLRRKGGGSVALGEVEDQVEERRDGTGGEGFDAWHGDSRRGCMGGKWYGRAVPD